MQPIQDIYTELKQEVDKIPSFWDKVKQEVNKIPSVWDELKSAIDNPQPAKANLPATPAPQPKPQPAKYEYSPNPEEETVLKNSEQNLMDHIMETGKKNIIAHPGDAEKAFGNYMQSPTFKEGLKKLQEKMGIDYLASSDKAQENKPGSTLASKLSKIYDIIKS